MTNNEKPYIEHNGTTYEFEASFKLQREYNKEMQNNVIKAINESGIDEEKLEELNNNLKEKNDDIDSTHIGIVNVNSRIKLFYGKEYGLSIKSDFGEGTIVTITIPV